MEQADMTDNEIETYAPSQQPEKRVKIDVGESGYKYLRECYVYIDRRDFEIEEADNKISSYLDEINRLENQILIFRQKIIDEEIKKERSIEVRDDCQQQLELIERWN
jgi:hypothetical protein